jgi:hypothetical protein
MAIRTIRQLPRRLPHARLFLDDIEEISNVLLEAYKQPLAKMGEEVKILYTAGDREMDSVGDLQAWGGGTTRFGIVVQGRYDRGGVRLRGLVNPEISLYSLDEPEAWAVYAKVKAVFDGRQFKVRNAITSLPAWAKVALYALLVLVLPNLVWWVLPRSRWTSVGWWTGFIALTVLVAYALGRPSRALFVRSHESLGALSARMKANLRDAVLIVVGALIYAVVSQLVTRLFK